MLRNIFVAWLLLILFFGGGFDAFSTANADAAEASSQVALVSASPRLLQWSPLVESEGVTLALADPKGVVRIHYFPQGKTDAGTSCSGRGAAAGDRKAAGIDR